MRFGKLGIVSIALLSLTFKASAELYPVLDVDKITNDKDVLITVMSEDEVAQALRSHPLARAERVSNILKDSLRQFNLWATKACDIGLARILDTNFSEHGYKRSYYAELFKALRVHNKIDDIFFDILNRSMNIYLKLKQVERGSLVFKVNDPFIFRKIVEINDVTQSYRDFTSWPDDLNVCSLGEYGNLRSGLKSRKGNQWFSTRDMTNLNSAAYLEHVIDFGMFNKYEVLNHSDALSYPIYLGGYLDKLVEAKNIMQYAPGASLAEVNNIYASQYQGRVEKITRRKNLYYKYNPTQIVMLAKVMEKASMRMGVDPTVETSSPKIVTNYVIKRNGTTQSFSEIYTLSPSEQYDFARKRLRMDIIELEGTKTFSGVKIDYEDIIVAALETGYINHHDLAYVVKYDDLWNPEVSRWKKFQDFLWSFGSTGALFLPAPWNVVGAVGLVFIQTKISKGQSGHENHENPGNIFN